MNVLVDTFPQTLEIDGVEYAINSDYRYSLSAILAFEDDDLTNYEKVSVLLQNIFADTVPEDVEQALDKCQYFLNAGQESKSESNERRLYSFSKDAGLIYAAFQATHGINLSDTDLHWWRFLNLFMDLGQDTTFCQLVSLRKRYYAGKTNKEENRAIRGMWEIFDIPDNTIMSLEDREKIAKLKADYQKAKEGRSK